jgi:hypothetical protein
MRSLKSLVLVLLLALPALLPSAPARADNAQLNGTAVAPPSGLACFSMTPAPAEKGKSLPSCDALCAQKGAACVSLNLNGAINPGMGCADPADGNLVVSCRCCTVGR